MHFELYNYNKAKELIQKSNDVNTFDNIIIWKNEANNELDEIQIKTNLYDEVLIELNKKLQNSDNQWENLPFFKKLLTKNKLSLNIKKNIESLLNYNNDMEIIKNQILNIIDLLPSNINEKKNKLQEIKNLKKQLILRKKEKSLEMREIRANARVSNAAISNQVYFTNSKTKRYERAIVRSTKESELKYKEASSFQIEEEILSMEKIILWLESIN